MPAPLQRPSTIKDREDRESLAMTAEEQLAFWNALVAPMPLTESQKRLGSIMRGDE
jgi:hypothetical protein